MPPNKWSAHVHIKQGGLNGWCEHCTAEARHAAIATTVRKVGYAKTIDKLNFLANIANKRNNRGLTEVAERDLGWTERKYGGES